MQDDIQSGQEEQVSSKKNNIFLRSSKAFFIIAIALGILSAGFIAFVSWKGYWPFNINNLEISNLIIPEKVDKNNQIEATSTAVNIGVSKVEVAWAKNLTPIKINYKGESYEGVEDYIAGTILNGDLKGQSLYLEAISTMGGSSFYHFVLIGEEKIFFGEITSADLYGNIGEEVKYTEAEIADISDIPDEIKYPGIDYILKNIGGMLFFSEVDLSRKLFNYPGIGDVYLSKDGCLVAEAPNHTVIVYDWSFPFVNKENGSLNLVFQDGKKNTEEYEFTRITGCGALCYYLNDVSISEDRLKIAGLTPSGETFYELSDTEDSKLKELYNDKNTVAFYNEQWQNQSKNKYTYEEFLSYKPLLYWKDPLGRWIEFKNKRFEIAAEMCKPVIYLYPKRKSELVVSVKPNGGFTYSEPVYDNGWKVEAWPDGKIIDTNSNKEYSYLFWEGIGLNYPIEDKGWVVKKEDLGSFLDEKLLVLGLSKKEINDFKDYWLGRLNEKPFYKISFLDQAQFDKIAPLSVSLRPDRIIRVMMTAKGLDNYVKVVPQELINASEREGFMIVEWGGVVLK
jgi:hypothetical protein